MIEKKQLRWQSLGHVLEQAALADPEKRLFIYEGDDLSYSQVNRRVNRTANALKALGVGKGSHVSVMLPNGFEFPIVWLALAKLGAVMVPTNTTYRERDLEYILSDAEASTIVLHCDYVAMLENIRPKLPLLQEIVLVGGVGKEGYHSYESMTGEASEDFIIENVNENDLLNIQYTSGTTGFPKGCMLTHRFWLLMAQLIVEEVDEAGTGTPEDVLLTAQPFYYIDPQWNTALALSAGIALVIVHRFSPSKFWPTVKEYGVTFFYLAGTMPFYLLELDEDPEVEKKHKVRMIGCGGMPPQFHKVFEDRWGVPLREGFGMTETGADMGVPLEDTDSVGSGAMGAPVPTKEAMVVDEFDEALPDGQVGELVIRGEPMMLGYWKRPEETERAMRNGWFHTGDLAFKDEKGYFHWVGRIKDMVRRSGENISSAEVEGVLSEHPEITAAAVVPVPDRLRGEEVKAYIVLKKGATSETVHPNDIVAFAKEKLSYFKVPRYIEFVESLPLTPSERVEKHKLVTAKDDLRTDSYDVADQVWR